MTMKRLNRHGRTAAFLALTLWALPCLAASESSVPAAPETSAVSSAAPPAASTSPDAAPASPGAAPSLPDSGAVSFSAFSPGERLTYSISYLGIAVGDLSLLIAGPAEVGGVSVWPLIGTAQSKPAFILYPVRDKFISWFDPRARLSVGNEFLANENKVVRRERTRFERGRGQASVRREGGGKPRRDKSYDIPAGAQDILAMLYLLRLQPLAAGDVFESPVFTGSKTFTLKASVVGKESIQTKAGKFAVKRVHVEVAFSGQLSAKREVHMFLTDDARHIPVRVDAEFFLGSLVADLISEERGF